MNDNEEKKETTNIIPYNKIHLVTNFIEALTLEELDYFLKFVNIHRDEIENLNKSNLQSNKIKSQLINLLKWIQKRLDKSWISNRLIFNNLLLE